jgi:hypothetical protein
MDRGTATIHIRPVVDRETIDDLVDVQELLLELATDDGPTRVIEIGRKRLPDRSSDSPNWGHVRAAGDPSEVTDLFDDDVYETATQGRRHQSATRVAARGSWALDRQGRTTRLHLTLEGEVDDPLLEQLHIHPEATYDLNVKNPRAASDAGLEPEERPVLPDELQQAFDGNRWAPADPPALLDHVGVEFVLVPVDEAPGAA